MTKILTATALVLFAAACGPTQPDRVIFSDPFPGGTAGSTGFGTGAGGGFVGSFDEAITVANPPPAPISGGTLTTIAQGHQAAVADPDRDQIVIVDLEQLSVKATIALEKGDEPGRLVEDGAGLVHVALRGAGAVATIDPMAGTVASRVSACQYPRGLAYDPRVNVVHVACAGGELVTLNAATGEVTRMLRLARDLRDVVIDGERLLVSRFRAAELLVVESNGLVSKTLKPPAVSDGANFAPAVAWRTVAAPGGGAYMVFQEEQTSEVMPAPGGYGGLGVGCGGIVQSAISFLSADGTGWTATGVPAVLPVDVAVRPDNTQVSMISATSLTSSALAQAPSVVSFVPPTPEKGTTTTVPVGCGGATPDTRPPGQIVGIAFDASGRLLTQVRAPMPALVVGDRVVTLPGESRDDTGQKLFHLGTAAGVACASCHPEGREDGHVWTFAGLGQRRTQTVGGGIAGTEPFHWNGDMSDFSMLAHEVFNSRMSGPMLQDVHVTALKNWIDAIPVWKPVVPADAAAAERGRALFNDANVGCATCHSGAKMTNNKSMDVGTGAAFQVPSLLGVRWRAPYLHHGCANTLDERFGTCGGGDAHGHVSSLTAGQRADLVAYLETR